MFSLFPAFTCVAPMNPLRLAPLALLFACPLAAAVLFSEIHYHPVEKPAFNPDGTPVLDLAEDRHEFIELHNAGATAVSLAGWSLAGGVDFVFPAGSQIPPGGHLVVGGQPDRLAAVYGLPVESILGPWTGRLSNQGEELRLTDSAGVAQDTVAYRAASPWAISADALGADDDWTGLNSLDHQYRGRSLERVSFAHPANDPANWLASPLAAGPSPGRANAIHLALPRPVVFTHDVRQANDGATLIRSNQSVRVECVFTATNGLGDVRLEWFREDLNATNKAVVLQPMWPVGTGGEARFLAEVPGQTNRALMRYRIRADRGAGDEVVSPRADDPFAWHGWFVTPARAATTNEIFDVFISRRSLDILRTNISASPRRVTVPDPPGLPRASWNATEPAVLIHRGRVYDVQIRHHGSQFRRDVNRRSYKLKFPAYARFEGRESFFLTDKDQRTVAGHTLFRAAGLPTSRTWWSDLYLNGDPRLPRLAQEEYDDFILERHHAEQAAAEGRAEAEPAGEFYKSQGTFEEPLGPYGRGDGSQLRPRTSRGTNVWTPLQRYERTYTQQMHGWKGHTAFEAMMTNHWLARSNRTTNPSGAITNLLRAYFTNHWDVDKALTHMAVFNWQGVWDDTIHNYYLWQQANGRWTLLPWDFDDQFDARPSSDSIYNGAPFAGPNYFKQSLVAAFRQEFRERAWWLNNTLLDPDNLAALGITPQIRNWSVTQQRSVNSQLAMGFFSRPLRPTNGFPVHRGVLGPFAALLSSPYRYNTNPVVAHDMSVWQLRETNRSWLEPLATVTNPGPSLTLVLPHERLRFGQTYGWRVQHVDALGHPSPWSAETTFRYGPDPDSAVQLSELLAVNEGVVRNGADQPDYVELVNRGDRPADVGDWSFTDDLTRPARYRIPFGTVIPPHGHLVLWCDSRNSSPGLHTGFGLSRDGETVALFAPGPSGPQLADVLTFGLQLPNLAVGRVGETGQWTLIAPSPLAANVAAPLGEAGRLRINEWLAAGGNWFELFNPEPRPVALGGLIFSDGVDDSPMMPLSFINAGEFLRLDADGDLAAGADHLGFRLSGNGGVISIRQPEGTLVDRVLYPRQTRDRSQGRVPDGGDFVYLLPAPSPGASNLRDSDGDTLPDVWETAHGLNPSVADAALDGDGDGWSNADEFRLGTSPGEADSNFQLRLLLERDTGTTDRLEFLATPGRRYVLERLGSPGEGWLPEHEAAPLPTTRLVPVPFTPDRPGGVFRVRLLD